MTIVDCSFHYSFLFFSGTTFSHRKSARIKKLVLLKLTVAPNDLGVHPFPDPVGHLGSPGGYFGLLRFSWKEWSNQAVRCCRRCGVAGGERVPPSPLGWYFVPVLSNTILSLVFFMFSSFSSFSFSNWARVLLRWHGNNFVLCLDQSECSILRNSFNLMWIHI